MAETDPDDREETVAGDVRENPAAGEPDERFRSAARRFMDDNDELLRRLAEAEAEAADREYCVPDLRRIVRDGVLEAEIRDQLRDQGLDEDSVRESLAVMRDEGMFDIRGGSW